MSFERQSSGGTFVIWGKSNLNPSFAKETSFVVDEGDFLEAVVNDIKESDTYGRIFEVTAKEHDGPLVVTGTTMLLRETGYMRDEDKQELPENEQPVVKSGGKRVVLGDKLRIHFNGMTTPKPGKKAAYDLWVEVDR